MLGLFRSRGYQKFKVKRPEKDIDTEEIFLDVLEHKKDKGVYTMETALSQRIFQLTFGFILVSIIFFFCYSFNLQVLSYEDYSAKAESNKYLSKQVNAQRGIIYDGSMNQLAFNSQQFELICYVDVISQDIQGEAQVRDVARILGIPFDKLMEDINKEESGKLLVAKDIEKEKAIVLKTKERDLSAFELITKNTRQYLDGNNFSHILGYVSGDTFDGESGIEKQYNDNLREDPGILHIERDAIGRKIKEEIIEPAKSGNNLVLNIDFDLQKKTSEYLEEVVKTYKASGGAVVAMNPQTGEILSLASNPSFDSNIFSRNLTTEQFNEIVASPDVSFYNRAIAGEYSLGSTIKPIIGVAALEEGIITPDTNIYCDEKIELSDGTTKSDWKFHGWTNLKKAIAESSNVFFYHLGGGYKDFVGLGIEKIEKYLNYFGFGNLTGIDLPGEKPGLIPNPQWKRELNGLSWYPGDTYNVSIGQGYIKSTPLQLTVAISAIVNGGKIVKPQVVKSILDENNNILESFNTKITSEVSVSSISLEEIKKSMKETVASPLGTARSLQYLPVDAGAKTGTAETGKYKVYHNWITAFAPYDEPEIVLTVVIENVPDNMGLANLVARELLGYYFGEKQRLQTDEEIINEAGN